jgi:hypothetical protein
MCGHANRCGGRNCGRLGVELPIIQGNCKNKELALAVVQLRGIRG